MSGWEEAAWQQLVGRLSETLTSYSYTQLAQLAFSLGSLAGDPAQVITPTHLKLTRSVQKDLANQLDMALASRMSELLGAPGAGQREVEECLGVAYTWLRTCGLEVWLGGGAWAHKAWKGRHNSALTSRLLSLSLLPALTAPQLVFTLFLCGLHRRIPMQIHINSQGQVVSATLYQHSTLQCRALPCRTSSTPSSPRWWAG